MDPIQSNSIRSRLIWGQDAGSVCLFRASAKHHRCSVQFRDIGWHGQNVTRQIASTCMFRKLLCGGSFSLMSAIGMLHVRTYLVVVLHPHELCPCFSSHRMSGMMAGIETATSPSVSMPIPAYMWEKKSEADRQLDRSERRELTMRK